MSESVAVRILLPLLYCGRWLIENTECDMESHRAKTLADTKPKPHVRIMGPATGENTIEPPPPRKRDQPDRDEPSGESRSERRASELSGWPGESALTSAGITTVAGLRELIAEHRDAWPKQVKGIGKATAADIGMKLAELDADDGEESAEQSE